MPVSSIVSICPDQRSKCICLEVSLQHCVHLKNPENINTIVLLKAHHDDVMVSMDKSHRFKFQKVNTKIYPSQNPHVPTAQVTHCCAFCFGSYYVSEKDTDDAIRFNLIEIKPNVTNENCWTIEYCLSHVFETCMGVCKIYK